MASYAALPIALTLAFALAMPLAVADQDVVAGPARVVTANQDSGDACGGENGYHVRSASARVEIYPGESVGADFSQYCSDQSSPWFENHGSGFFLAADHRVDQNAGPQVYVAYSDYDMNGWRWCGLQAGVAGVPLQLGCLPMGTKLPLLPALP